MYPKCIVCEGETSLIRHLKFGDYYGCKRCDFITKDKNCHVSVPEELNIYNSHNNSIEDLGYVTFLKKFLESAVMGYRSAGKKGFDFGSGPSPVLAQILQSDYGYEMDIYDLFYAKERIYSGKKYDLITTTEVVEHLADPIPYFEMFAELMEDDGILAVMTLFHLKDPEHFLQWHYMRDYTHISFYTLRTFEYIAKKVGLKILYTNGERYITFAKDITIK